MIARKICETLYIPEMFNINSKYCYDLLEHYKRITFWIPPPPQLTYLFYKFSTWQMAIEGM